MPYRWIYAPAEELLEYRGVRVYRTYPGNDLERGPRTYIFVTRPDAGEDAGFDVRELATWRSPALPPSLDRYGSDTPENRDRWRIYNERALPEAIRMAIREAIDLGLIGVPEERLEPEVARTA